MKNEELAKEFIKAIKTLAENEDNLQNFEDYLTQHFDIWFQKFANTPESLTAELKMFANMEDQGANMEHFRINFDELNTLDKLAAFFKLLSEPERDAFAAWYWQILERLGGLG